MSLRLRILLFMAVLLIVAILGGSRALAQPWPAVIAVATYLVLVFPMIGSR